MIWVYSIDRRNKEILSKKKFFSTENQLEKIVCVKVNKKLYM